ncbi:MAG: hypothetical protein KAR40_01535 [Candidatus Sabulitectum sp.]|nr:hypothetical protein [Candidatus Sabulitectum sp.]
MRLQYIWMVSAMAATAAAITFTPQDTLNIYSRPDSRSEIWSQLLPDENVTLEVKTASGWFGFDPGVAQAANTCSFRYRWLAPDGITASADSLPVVWAPVLDVSYAMMQTDTPVYPDQDTASTPLAVIPANSAAAILGITATWFKVDLSDSPENLDIQGWIQSEAVSIN